MVSSYLRRNDYSIVTESESKRQITLVVNCKLANVSFLSGTHRIQRQPPNDQAGRKHTSTATIAVLPYAPEPEVQLTENDYTIETFKASGPGGQHKNKNATAVRLRHSQTNIVVVADGRSLRHNIDKAVEELRSRLQDRASESVHDATNNLRASQILTGERPVKDYTYNAWRGDVLRHEDGKRWQLKDFMKGKI